MVELALRQQQLWNALMDHSPLQPLLRISREDDCFWICDLPRRIDTAACEAAKKWVEEAGFIVTLHEQPRLWHIDLSPLDGLFEPESEPFSSLPKAENLHTVYALYRLLQTHQKEWNQQITPLLRSILKLTLKAPTDAQAAFITVTSQCAALLNRKQPLPTAACRALAQWMRQEDKP